MSAYVTAELVASFGHQFDSLGADESIDLLLAAASRFFDRECMVADDFFAPATGTPTVKTIYGDGTAYLKLPPFVGSVTLIDIPASVYSVTANDYAVVNGYAVWSTRLTGRRYGTFEGQNRYTGWEDGYPVSVTADWGFAEVPADVQMAVIDIVWAMRRTADPAFERISGGDGKPSPVTLPGTATATIEKYKRLYSGSVVFA